MKSFHTLGRENVGI